MKHRSKTAAQRPSRRLAFETYEPRILLSALLPVHGSIDAPGQTNQYSFTLNDAEPVALAVETDVTGESAVDLGNVSSLGGYYRELRAFVESLRKGEHPTQATGPQALESLRVVEAEIESALCGRTVSL